MSNENTVKENSPAPAKAPETAAKSDAAPVTAAKAAKKPAKKAKKTAKKTGRKAVKRAAKTAKTAKKAVNKTVKTANQAAASNARTARAATRTINKQSTQIMESIMTQGKTQFDQLAQDAAKNGKEQADAFMQSGTIFMKGLEDITKAYMSLAQSSAEKNSQAVKAILGCKTINEFTEAQNKWAQQNFDDFMVGTTKISELSVKVATEAFEPINDQVSKTIKKASESLAA